MTPDPLRSLDAVDPPDQWDDIVARSASSTGGPPTDLAGAPERPAARGSRRLLAAAAVILVLAALAGAVAVTRSTGSDAPPMAGNPLPEQSRMDDPSGIWGHEWQLVDIQADDATEDAQLHVGDGRPLQLDLREQDRFSITACNEMRGTLKLRGDVLAPTEVGSTAGGCTDPLEDLIALLFDAPTRVDLQGPRLVLTQIPDPRVEEEAPRAIGPQLRYTFVRPDALALRQQLWGRAWQVTELGIGDDPRTPVPEGQMEPIDATTLGRIGLPECGQPWAMFESDDLARRSEWSQVTHSCPYGPPDQMANQQLIRSILSDAPEAEVDRSTLSITSPSGTLRATSVPVTTGRKPERLYGERWVVVAAYDRGERVDLAGDLLLDGRGSAHEVTLPACGGPVGGPSELVTEGEVTRLRVERTPANPRGDCVGAITRVFPFFDALFAGEPELHIHGNRASLAIPGKRVILLRLGPI